MSAANCVTNKLPLQPLDILLSNVSAKSAHLSKMVVVTFATNPPKAVMTLKSSPQQQNPMETINRVDKSAYSDANFAGSGTNTANDKEVNLTIARVGAVHYESSTKK